MQSLAYFLTGKMLSSLFTHVTMSLHTRPTMNQSYHQSMDRICGDLVVVQPSIKRRPPGRPKKKRVRGPNELTSRKAGISTQCKACDKLWHNRRSCKGKIGGNFSLPGTTNKTNTSNKVIYGYVCEIVAFQYSILMCVNFLFVGQYAQLQL